MARQRCMKLPGLVVPLMVIGMMTYNVDQNVRNYSGKTQLDFAMSKRYKELVEMLGVSFLFA